MWREAGRNKSRKASWIQTVQGLGRQAARPGLAQVNPAEYGGQQTLGGEWIRAHGSSLARRAAKATSSRGSLSSDVLTYPPSEQDAQDCFQEKEPCTCSVLPYNSEAPLGQPAQPLKKKTNFYHVSREICLFLNGSWARPAEEATC